MKHFIILFLFINLPIFAQINSLSGRVVDSETNKPLAFVNIIFENSFKGIMSTDNGSFEMKSDFKGNEYVIFSHIGYFQKRFSISEIINKKDLLIKLEPKIISSQTVLVTGSIGKEGITPIAFSKVSRKDIEKNYINQDIPEYLSTQPSITSYSESGNGTGYNFLSIRGFDQRRISVSVNGIPQNDPEDNNVYWLDMPDLLASTELIQIQRGAGSGVVGYPAIGGSINIITSAFSDKPKFDFSSSLGSYNTRKYTASFSSGLLNEKYSFYAKLSKTLSSGYRDNTWIDFNSYHISAVRYDKDFTTQVNLFGGPIGDGLGYTGLPKFAIKDKKLRRENYSYWEADKSSYSYTLSRRDDEIENYSQPHFEILNEFNFSNTVSLNSALFLVIGNGFFDYDGSWADTSYFRITSENGFKPLGNISNALIRAQVDNKQYGWIPRLSIKHNNGELIFGAEIRFHRSLHWGSVNYAENLPAGITKDYKYYQFKGGKDIMNFFIHETYKIGKFNLLGEFQTAYHKFKLYDEMYAGNNFSISNLFLNGRIGVNFELTENVNSYISFARVNREPRLSNYYDAAESSGGAEPQFHRRSNNSYDFTDPFVKPEIMNDFEFGSLYKNENISLGINLFYMSFNDEIVKQSQTDRFGNPLTGNAERTLHTGIELTTSFKINDNLSFILNGTYSKNTIRKGFYYDKYTIPNDSIESNIALDLSGNNINGFPELLANGLVKFNMSGVAAIISAKYVGEFYSDNYGKNLGNYLNIYPGFIDYEDNTVPGYFTTDLFASYQIDIDSFPNNLKIYLQINNIFDNLYASYAIGKEFFPAAERNILAGINIGL